MRRSDPISESPKKVRLVEFIDQIPKSPTGKILRRELPERERRRIGAV